MIKKVFLVSAAAVTDSGMEKPGFMGCWGVRQPASSNALPRDANKIVRLNIILRLFGIEHTEAFYVIKAIVYNGVNPMFRGDITKNRVFSPFFSCSIRPTRPNQKVAGLINSAKTRAGARVQ